VALGIRYRLLSITILIFSLTACGGEILFNDQNTEEATAVGENPDFSADSVANFGATLYPILSAHCGSCHSPLAPSSTRIAPFFAEVGGGDAITRSYDAILNTDKVNFPFPEQSRVVRRLDPEQHQCWPNAGACSQNASEILAAIEEWKRRDNTNEQEFTGSRTANVTIPNGISTSDQDFDIPLRELNTTLIPVGAANAGSVLRVAIRLSGDGISYVISNPRMRLGTPPNNGAQYGVSFNAWLFFLNDQDVTPDSSPYKVLNFSAATNGIFSTVVYQNAALPAISVPRVNGPGSDQISLGIRAIGSQSPAEIRFINFQQVLSQRCNACHTAEISVNAGLATARVVPAFANFTRIIDYTNDNPDVAGPGMIVSRNPNASWLFQTLIIQSNLNLPNAPVYNPAYPIANRPADSSVFHFSNLRAMPPGAPIGANFNSSQDPLRIVYDFIMGL